MKAPLHSLGFEHDSCGVGMIAHLDRKPSHSIVEDALTILESLEHRGASGADPSSGDGAGILLAFPETFLRSVASDAGITLEGGRFAVAVWMTPRGTKCEATTDAVSQIAIRCGLEHRGWRPIPTDGSMLGAAARASEPDQWMQFLVPSDPSASVGNVELALWRYRRLVTAATSWYASSCSSRTLILKGMLTSTQLRTYFIDLGDPRLSTSIALVHSRFSTNTFPSWPLAQPFRLIAHNGEINTIRSNRHWMRAREDLIEDSSLGFPLDDVTPVATPAMSDSASFDEVAELLHVAGRTLPQSILMLIPEAWERSSDMDPQRRDFYRYHSALMEAWDGPASVTFCNGDVVGAVLDRNGLRPARFCETVDRRVIFASEVGVLPIEPTEILRKGRLQPGRMFLVDTVAGRIVDDAEIKESLSSAAPYGEWLDAGQVSLNDLERRAMLVPEHATVVRHQQLFGYSDEDLRLIITPMATAGDEPIGSMGSDTALAALSRRDHPLYDFFSQQFAQVTNPPLDAIREELVTSVRVAIGPQSDLLTPGAQHCRQVVLASPVLSLDELAKLRYIDETSTSGDFATVAVDGLFDVTDHPGAALQQGLDELEERVLDAVRGGASFIILSDRNTSATRAPIPSLLATAAVHNRLVSERLRARVALLVESADAREVHHGALLLGFGASAFSPYLAFDTIDDLVTRGEIGATSSEDARYRYAKALTKGILKVMSKMGVSTVASYIGSQLFEAVGLGDDVMSRCFPDVVSRVGGAGFEELARSVLRRHATAYGEHSTERLSNKGEYQWRRDGEVHLFNPRTVFKLQHATRAKRMDIFREYTTLVNDQSQNRATLRSLLTLVPASAPVPLEEVESARSIIARFSTGAMSYGSISAEAHETLAIAMNRLGGKSNTGEGGEDADRYDTSDPQMNRRSAIKQIASGRFGVTTEYLVNADDLQIKIAQGAKPGEGGQLPGTKVYPWIAATRHSTPGVGLISPPPHHDIYSIEDIAQLIYDLKSANRHARIHVKLVSESGVGTVAAGVAKAHADVVLISGHDGGTGAAPLTSLKHAGTPWELGLAETQQTLVANGLRDRIVVQVDGQLKTGRDVMVAALLGAEEFGFATAPLVVSGCVMMRVCHLDTCPVGIATQNPELRRRFTGSPEFVETFFEFLAEEVRELLASLGLRSLDEAIGRTDLLAISDDAAALAGTFRLSSLLDPPDLEHRQHRRDQDQDHGLDAALDWKFLDEAMVALGAGQPFRYDGEIHNTDRAVGTLTGSELVRRFGADFAADDAITLALVGSAGQSLGAFLPRGITIELEGDANDYVGKGLSGGRITVRAPSGVRFDPSTQVIAGNVIGYGATGGELFLHGVVGERLGVRNSGATIVVEGTGDHACEYMTGGRVVILGPVGRNLAAGMSGGSIYWHDPDGTLSSRLSAGEFDVDLLDANDDQWLHGLLERYVTATNSARARDLLAHWSTTRMDIVRIESVEFQRATAVRHG